MFANARRLCEVFCISQNLQMYEVPERASDGKASGRCSGSPKGFRYIGPRIGDSGGLESQNYQSCTKLSNSLLLFSKFKKKGNRKGCCDKKRRNFLFYLKPPFRQYDVRHSFFILSIFQDFSRLFEL
jgi:hypothetical protein